MGGRQKKKKEMPVPLTNDTVKLSSSEVACFPPPPPSLPADVRSFAGLRLLLTETFVTGCFDSQHTCSFIFFFVIFILILILCNLARLFPPPRRAPLTPPLHFRILSNRKENDKVCRQQRWAPPRLLLEAFRFDAVRQKWGEKKKKNKDSSGPFRISNGRIFLQTAVVRYCRRRKDNNEHKKKTPFHRQLFCFWTRTICVPVYMYYFIFHADGVSVPL